MVLKTWPEPVEMATWGFRPHCSNQILGDWNLTIPHHTAPYGRCCLPWGWLPAPPSLGHRQRLGRIPRGWDPYQIFQEVPRSFPYTVHATGLLGSLWECHFSVPGVPYFFSALPKKATRVTRAGASVSSQVPYFWVAPGIHHPSSQAPSGPQRGELSTMRAAGEYTGFVPDMQPLGWPYLVRGLIGKLMCICIFTLHNIHIYIIIYTHVLPHCTYTVYIYNIYIIYIYIIYNIIYIYTVYI